MSEEEVNKIIEVYDSVIADLKQENTQLKQSLENAQNIYKNSHKYTSECEDKVIMLKAQQREFINYLRELSNWYSADGVKQGMVNDILSKYKEIIDKGLEENE